MRSRIKKRDKRKRLARTCKCTERGRSQKKEEEEEEEEEEKKKKKKKKKKKGMEQKREEELQNISLSALRPGKSAVFGKPV
jgi:hypothetical protein